jgi:hypothetical protein
MGRNNRKTKQPSDSVVGNVFKVAAGRAHKAKHQKIKNKIKKMKVADEDKVKRLNTSLDNMQDDVRKRPQVQEAKLNDMKRTDYTQETVNVDEAADILEKL